MKLCRKILFLFQVPIAIPIIVLVSSVFLVIAPIINDPKVEYIYSMTFMAFGALIYVPFVSYKLKLPLIGKILLDFLQELLQNY